MHDDGSTSTTYTAAVGYVKRGWAVIPVHGIMSERPGQCTCGNPGCLSPGKHPVEKNWPDSGRFSMADCYTVWMEGRPDLNVGILTGKISGIFVLDIDPRNGGDASLAELIARYGQLPETYTARTGSGGRHFFFLMPDFAISNKNSKIGSGIDIKADRGQVVAAPSISAAGHYDVIRDMPVAQAPAWLLDLLRVPSGMEAGETVMVDDLPAYSDLDSDDQYRYSRYAERIIDKECEAYAGWKAGDGSYRLFTAACNLIEVAQSPWNLITKDDVLARLEAARRKRVATHPSGGGQSEEELLRTFQSAAARVAGKGRDVPPDPNAGIYFDVPMPTRSPTPTGSSGTLTAGGASEAVTGGVVSAPEMVAAYDAVAERERLVQREMQLLEIREEAKRRYKAGATADTEDFEWMVQSMLTRMLTADDLDELPNPEPLIVDILDMDSESWIIGAPGGFKSFVALDWAGHVGSGLKWQGKATTQGNVLYVVAEGAKGIKLRKRAWCETYGPMKNVHFLPEPVQVDDQTAWAVLIEAARRIKPVMIVLDTQARITVNLNENTSELGVLIDSVRQLRVATGACVLVVHHTGRNGNDARGWSGLDGAQDSEIKVVRPDPGSPERKYLTAEIIFEKQKDSSEDASFPIQMMEHDWGVDPVTARRLTSLSIKPIDDFHQPVVKKPDWEANITENQAAIIGALRDHSNENGLSKPEILTLVNERAKQGIGKAMGRTSLNTALVALASHTDSRKALVIERGSKYILSEKLD